MRLVYKGTDKEVKKGDVLTSFRGEKMYAKYWREPTHGVGKITVKRNKDDDYSCFEYYVTVFNLEWVE